MTKLSQKYLSELFDYFPETGELFWKERPVRHFSNGKTKTAKQIAHTWNAAWAHKEAGYLNNKNYKRVTIDGKTYFVHRVIYALVTGKWIKMIDHDNGKPNDNRWINFNPSSYKHNGKNQKKHVTNTSGVTGVYKTPNGKWRARIEVNGVKKSLGIFVRKKEAITARRQAEQRYGFHLSHGRR